VPKKNPIDAFKTLAVETKHTKNWQVVGWWGMFGLTLTLSFYSVVSGWAIAYLIKSLKGTFVNLQAPQVIQVWQTFLHNPLKLIMYHTIFVIITLWVVARGVHRGLERASIIMVPLLFIVLFFLVAYAFSNNPSAFAQAFHFLFDPNFHKINGTVIINAVGHAFFTLAIGVGAMAIYGSYLPKNVSIAKSIAVIVSLDVLVALLSGLAIFPIVFAHHLSPQGGPGLMFITLPIAYAHMHWGHWIGSLFFILLLFAAWTSSINIAEPLIAAVDEKTTLNRHQACWVIGVLVWALGLISVFSFNYWSHVKLFGHFSPFIFITDLVTNVILPIGGIAYAIFSGWILPRKMTTDELALQRPVYYKIWHFLVCYVAPIAILAVFISSVL